MSVGTVVLDTNVVMSGLFFGGLPGEILQAWSEGRFSVAVSPAILEEYWRTGRRLSERFPGVDPIPFLTLLSTETNAVETGDLDFRVCDDPDDDKFLHCAVASGASCDMLGQCHGFRSFSFWELSSESRLPIIPHIILLRRSPAQGPASRIHECSRPTP